MVSSSYSLGYQIIEMTRRAGGFFAQPEHCQKLLLDVSSPFLHFIHSFILQVVIS